MKVFKGGYKIVSLLNIDITSDFTIPGIYDDIKDSHGKPILVSEINVGGEKMNDAYTIVKQDNTDYIIEVYGYSLTIASDDSVTVASLPEITSIGTGLTLTDGELSASSGGDALYAHNIDIRTTTTGSESFVNVLFISKSSTPMAKISDLMTAMNNAYVEEYNHYIVVSGIFVSSSKQYFIIDCQVWGTSAIRVTGREITDLSTSNYKDYSTTKDINDRVYEIK